MKKILALLLALALCTTFVAAVQITPVTEDDTPGIDVPAHLYFGDKTVSVAIEPSAEFTAVDDAFGTKIGDTKYEISCDVISSHKKMLSAEIVAKPYEKDGDKGAKLILELTPAKSYFTVEDTEVTVSLSVSQKAAGGKTVKSTAEYKIVVGNKVHFTEDFWELADGSYSSFGSLTYPVIDVSVFDAARGDKLILDYDDYAVTFDKVKNQKTSLYLKANTGTIDGDKVVASIAFAPTRVKDAAKITAPISADDENLYGDVVYVYAVDNGKPVGDAIPAEVIDHQFLVFGVPAGSVLGSYVAYGEKYGAEKTATKAAIEKPTIPETGADNKVTLFVILLVLAGLISTAVYILRKERRMSNR